MKPLPADVLDDLARRWARELPQAFAVKLAAALRSGVPAVRALQQEAVGILSVEAVKRAKAAAKAGDGPYLAGLLRAHLRCGVETPRVTPVWTGPSSAGGQSRLTLAVVGDLIAAAQKEIVLASFATIPGDGVRKALDDAADRGVNITLVLERPQDNPSFKGALDPLSGLKATRLHWPAHVRESNASLHAKLLIVDREVALVGSANFTSAAMERSLECGLLVQGGLVPAALADHLLHAEGLAELP